MSGVRSLHVARTVNEVRKRWKEDVLGGEHGHPGLQTLQGGGEFVRGALRRWGFNAIADRLNDHRHRASKRRLHLGSADGTRCEGLVAREHEFEKSKRTCSAVGDRRSPFLPRR